MTRLATSTSVDTISAYTIVVQRDVIESLSTLTQIAEPI